MRHLVLLLMLFGLFGAKAQEELRGRIFTEDDILVEKVMVINMRTNERAYSDEMGRFSIIAKNEDEIRLIKKGYDRLVYVVRRFDFNEEVDFKMKSAEVMIEELVISNIKLTGNLEKDSKSLDKKNQNDKLQKSLGIAEIEEKVKNITHTGISFDPNNLLGGGKKKKRNLDKYEKQESNAEWIRLRVEESFFIDKGIPKDRIVEFVNFAVYDKPELNNYIAKRNLLQVKMILEKIVFIYLERLKETK